MPHISGRETFSFKYVPKVRTAPGTQDFGPQAVRIRFSGDRTRYFSVKTRLATSRMEFIFRTE